MNKLDVIKPEELVEIANEKGKEFSKIETNQIRNFFAAVVSIKNKVELMKEFDYSIIETDLLLLKPKLAYAAGRNKNVRPFKDFIDEVIDAMKGTTNQKKAVNNFLNLMEGVVAYHKFYSKNN